MLIPTTYVPTSPLLSSPLGLLHVMAKYVDRKDVVRASCRILMNVCHHPGVTNALGKAGVLEKLLEALNIHTEAKDVLEATALLFKGTYVHIHVRTYML